MRLTPDLVITALFLYDGSACLADLRGSLVTYALFLLFLTVLVSVVDGCGTMGGSVISGNFS